MKHTPGPWTIGPHQRIISGGWSIRIKDDSAIAYVLGEKNPELRANARLVAKSPEMYRLLTLVNTARAKQDHDFDVDDWYAQVRALIARIEEEPT